METAILIARSAAESKGALYTVLTYVPITVVGLLMAPLVYAMFKWMRQYNDLLIRSLKHMDQIEAKTDEMIRLLKEIRDKR